MVFTIQDLVWDDVQARVHAERLSFYADSALNVTEELLNTLRHNDRGYTVHSMSDMRQDADGGYSILDSTTKPFINLLQDVPRILKKHLKQQQKFFPEMVKDIREYIKHPGLR